MTRYEPLERKVVSGRGERDQVPVGRRVVVRVLIEHVEIPNTRYSGQHPTRPVTSGTRPTQPQGV